MGTNKYRAWDEKHKEYLKHDHSQVFSNGTEYEYSLSVMISKYSDCCLVYEQYTGLKDKNGKEIYESDIVRGSEKMQVVWNNGDASFKLICPELGWIYNLSSFTDTLEIISNIHETALEEKE